MKKKSSEKIFFIPLYHYKQNNVRYVGMLTVLRIFSELL